MVRLQKSAQCIELTTDAYTLSFEKDRPWYIQVTTAAGTPVADLFVGSSVDTLHGRDDLEPCGPPYLTRELDATVVEFRSRSSCWGTKRYVFVCGEKEVTYRVSVAGQGRLDRCHLLSGSLPEDTARLLLGPSGFRPGYERPYRDVSRGSRAQFDTFFSARPTAAERDLRLTWEDDELDLFDAPARHGGLDAFLPGLWAVAFELAADQPWVTLGLAPTPEQLDFHRFSYRGGLRFGCELDYAGAVTVNGEWTSPDLVLNFGGRDAYSAFRGHVAALETRHGPLPPAGVAPAWWQRPVFDGTGHQCFLARGGDPAAACTEATYVDALARLEQVGLDPGVLWLGPGWWSEAGPSAPHAERWSDLKAFIAGQHERFRRVLLTWPLWSGTVDDVRLAIGRDGLDADGLRLVELGHPDHPVSEVLARLRALREAARTAKSDALIAAPVANPCFAWVVDQVTLGSLWSDRRSPAAALRHRAQMARLASPAWLMAVEQRHPVSREAWREAVELQAKLGVPVLAYVDGLDNGEALDADDLAEVASTWRQRL